VQAITKNMLQRNLVHVLASDTHFSDGPRSPKLGTDSVTKVDS